MLWGYMAYGDGGPWSGNLLQLQPYEQDRREGGDKVQKGAVLGQTGTTGLAAGDHLHFAINLQGEFVDPLEWWDPHWIRDQVEGVWAHAGARWRRPQLRKAVSRKGKGKKKIRQG